MLVNGVWRPNPVVGGEQISLTINGDVFTLDGMSVLVNGVQADVLGKGPGQMARLCFIREALRLAENSLI